MVTNPNASPLNDRCSLWLESLVGHGVRVILPEIADYEVRRALVRAGKVAGIRRLDALAATPGIEYLPLTTAAMRRAAEFWAEARRRGQPTAGAKALDGDVILAAQASLIGDDGEEPVIATLNVAHLARFASALTWEQIGPG